MNDATAIRPPRREDYESIVKAMRPHCDGEELMLRSSLMLMRDRAISTKRIASSPSWTLLDVVEREAGEGALSFNISVEELRDLQRACRMCVLNASAFDTLYGQRFSSDGEANAGG